MNRRSLLRGVATAGLVGLAGCGGVSDGDTDASSPTRSTSTPTETETATPEPDPEIVEEVVGMMEDRSREWKREDGVDDLPGEFLATLKDGGHYTENGRAFVSRLERIRESVSRRRAFMAAVSVVEFDEISDDDLTVVDRWLDSPTSFREEAFVAGPASGGFEGLIGGLIDTTGDGIRDGLLLAALPAGVNLFHEPAPEVADRVDDLKDGGYTERSIRYLGEVGRHWRHRDRRYGEWSQADRLGLLAGATEGGEVTEEEVWGIRNDSENGLINAQAEAFGTDPEATDTSGDGFDDHLLWLMREEYGVDVHPTEPNVFVEVASVEGIDPLTDEERRTLVDLFREEPPGGPIHLHLYEGPNDVEPLGDEEDIGSRAVNVADRGDLGHHFVLLNDRGFDFDGIDDRRGYNTETYSGVDGSLPKGPERLTSVVHELGHSFGIRSSTFDGVDSESYSEVEYDSVMNYNQEDMTFNAGEPFDDWEHMRELEFGHRRLDISRLERTWEVKEEAEGS